MLSLNLAVAAAVALALFVIIGFIQAIREKTQVGCLSNFLVFIALAASIASAVLITLGNEQDSPVPLIILGSVVVLLVLSIIIYVLERRGEQFKRLYSRGLLGIGVGIIIAVGFFFTLFVPSAVFPLPTATPIVAGIQESQDSTAIAGNIVPTQQANTTATPRATYTPTQTYTPLPPPSPTRTRRAYVPPTITLTPEEEQVSENCDARVTVNLNVRAEPTTDADIVAIIPEDTFVRIVARNDDGNWWRTEFQGEQGWVSGDFLELDPICTVE